MVEVGDLAAGGPAHLQRLGAHPAVAAQLHHQIGGALKEGEETSAQLSDVSVNEYTKQRFQGVNPLGLRSRHLDLASNIG